MKVNYGELTNLELISERDFSKVYKANIGKKQYCVKHLKPCHRFSLEFYRQSYLNVTKLGDKTGLVEIFNHYEKDGEYIIIMEYVPGPRIEYKHSAKYAHAMNVIFMNLVRQNCLNLDYAPINFLVNKKKQLVMIDLDTVVEFSTLTENPQEADFNWSWFGSRMGKFLKEHYR